MSHYKTYVRRTGSECAARLPSGIIRFDQYRSGEAATKLSIGTVKLSTCDSRSRSRTGWPSSQSVYSFSQSIRLGFDAGLINERVAEFVESHARKLNAAIDDSNTRRFEYFGLCTLYDPYLDVYCRDDPAFGSGT